MQFNLARLLGTALVATSALSAHAGPVALDLTSQGAGYFTYGGTLGWVFKATQDIVVTSLGSGTRATTAWRVRPRSASGMPPSTC